MCLQKMSVCVCVFVAYFDSVNGEHATVFNDAGTTTFELFSIV